MIVILFGKLDGMPLCGTVIYAVDARKMRAVVILYQSRRE